MIRDILLRWCGFAARFGSSVAVCAMLAGSACGKTPPPSDPPRAEHSLPYASLETGSGIRIHALRAGWVRVKQTHRELDVVPSLRFPIIINERQWADWMPIVVYAIERADRSLIVVDTGAAPDILEQHYFACDRRDEWFYRRNLDFSVADGDTLEERMREVGLDPARVTDVVISHFHADHLGGLSLFPQARVLVGPGNWPEHTGSFTCQLGDDFEPTVVEYQRRPVAVFEQSLPLSEDGRIAMVPLPGHTPGHAGVVVMDGERAFIVAGDATFDDEQTMTGAVSGATQQVRRARRTQAQLSRALGGGAVLLPAHDPTVFEKLTCARVEATADCAGR